MAQRRTKKENAIRRVLFNEVSLIFSITGVVLASFIYLTRPQQDANIAIEILKAQNAKQDETISGLVANQKNDLHTLEQKMTDENTKIETLTVSVAELRTIIEERIPKKK